MPQAVKIKERKRHGRNSESYPGVESVNLLDFGMGDSYSSYSVFDDSGKIQKTEKVVEKECRGINLLEEGADYAEQRSSQAEVDDGRAREHNRENKPDLEQQGVPADAEGNCDKVPAGTGIETGKRKRRSKKTDGGTGKEHRQPDQEVKGRERRKREVEREIEFTGVRGDFREGSTIMTPRAIEIGPKTTDNELEVEIQMDGVIYTVSAWSVIGNVYHQGLDSRYLVKYYKG